ncbi:hypothetical protein ACH3VR_07105 [Microbacterium sp. B2969]|uniref:Lipoprotein n=1 Tax=Microbacterium alkaliflavum TaxID=3248839 RepID=A0ABW7Q5I5_9MICO
MIGWIRGAFGAAVVIAVVAGATACTMSPTSTSTPSASASPTPTGTASPTVEIKLADGDLLDPNQTAAWADPLKSAPGYTVDVVDDGSGSWSYTSDATGCTIGYWQGALTRLDASSDDSNLSDELLAAQFGTTTDQIAAFAKDDIAPFRTPSELVQTRAVAGADDESGTTYVIAARAFAALNQGFVASLRCPADTNVAAVWSLLSSTPNAFQIVFTAKK